MVFHLSAPLPRFSTTKGRFSATNKGFVYARFGLSELIEVCAPRDVGSFHPYIHIEATQMTEEHQRTTHLDSVVPPSTQLHLLNLFGGDNTPYESLHVVVKLWC
ncbi:uncharacterized protein LACBIDRAFT_313075 [Laccaria bicolor S238N-H82]|uniref:Predicted protein n=1 Tax=Laccaria bicolor (strain S238N-H82 / ATCC MYA-4686) TaxID=486041 RepID=B0DXG8_LACBS|nr:uncharacterized protein LACBIDRAFT_313075 [Laccaria bicolor S238N-H82]EDR00675.1 predicted protein [Laccaria bicolor S238N-H82]|eukprot:XP_001888684.1 predicted protein [Laccaria bicolor S238N-H82]